MYATLFVFLEGPDDERFFRAVVAPLFQSRYASINYIQHAGKNAGYINSYINSIAAMNTDEYRADYLFFNDFDLSRCITGRKNALMRQYRRLDAERIVVVRKMIESWYVAGLDQTSCADFGLRYAGHTEGIDKRFLESCMPRRFNSLNLYLIDMLARFDHEIAIQQNTSYAYLIRKFVWSGGDRE